MFFILLSKYYLKKDSDTSAYRYYNSVIFLAPFVLAFLIFPAMVFYEYRLKPMRAKLLKKIEKGKIRTIDSIKEIL